MVDRYERSKPVSIFLEPLFLILSLISTIALCKIAHELKRANRFAEEKELNKLKERNPVWDKIEEWENRER